MTIDASWDWACLDGCFGETKIKPIDMSRLIERNGRFLLVEIMYPGIKIPYSQDVSFRRLVQTGYFTVIIIWGINNNPQQIVLRTSREIKYYVNATSETLWYIVAQWFDWANNKRIQEPKRRLA